MTDSPAAPAGPWRAGLGRADATAWEPGMSMMGWGQLTHRTRSVATALHARALVVEGPEGAGRGRVALVSLALCGVPQRLREAIVARLASETPVAGASTPPSSWGLDSARVLVCATHTHCGPAGIDDGLLYPAQNFGFAYAVFDRTVEAAVEAIGQAVATLAPARLSVGAAGVPASAPVAFNRSLTAYNHNPDVAPAADRVAATDRALHVLRVATPEGVERGLFGLLASHATTVHADTDVLHADHPGHASARLEASRGGALDPAHGPYVAVLGQAGAGDVTPNHVRDATRGLVVGPVDDLSWARAVGETFADVLARAADAAAEAPPLTGEVSARLRYVDFHAAQGAWNGQPVVTRRPRVAVSMVMGTLEGPGPLAPLRPLLRAAHGVRRRVWRWGGRHRDPRADLQVVFGDLDRGLDVPMLGLFKARRLGELPIRGVDPVVDYYRGVVSGGVEITRPWVSTALPAQVLRLGELVLGAIAMEPTTHAARKLRAALAEAAPDARHAWVIGYANAFVGYCTTPEEYEVQGYEGGHTVFGRWTLPAWIAALTDTARQPAGSLIPGVSPQLIDRATLLRERELGRAAMHPRHLAWVAEQDGTIRTA